MSVKTKDEICFTTLDLYLAAFLSMKGSEPTLEKQGTRVVFRFPSGPNISALVDQYNLENPQIRILDYVYSVKKIRGRMLNVRGGA